MQKLMNRPRQMLKCLGRGWLAQAQESRDYFSPSLFRGNDPLRYLNFTPVITYI